LRGLQYLGCERQLVSSAIEYLPMYPNALFQFHGLSHALTNPLLSLCVLTFMAHQAGAG